MLFSEIIGFNETKEKLIEAVNKDFVAHAQLFLGNEGSPNLPLALAYATYLNCEQRLLNDACGTCASCIKMNKYIHPDFHFAFPVSSTKAVASKDAISRSFLKEWRQFLLESPHGNARDWSLAFGGENKQLNISRAESREILKSLTLKAFEAKYKIMLIWLPEFMHVASANAILKILEEPPEKTVFLLVSDNSEKLLTTILSRTQIVKIRTFNDEELKQILGNEDADEKSIEQVIRLSDGNLNTALSLLNQLDNDNQEMFGEWMRYCYMHDFTNLVNYSELFQKMTKEEQKALLQYGLQMMRETMVATVGPEKIMRSQGNEKVFVDNFSKVLPFVKTEQIVNFFNTSFFHLERNANAKILFLDLSLRIARLMR